LSNDLVVKTNCASAVDMERITNNDCDREVKGESTGLIDKFIALIDNPSEERLSNVAAELEALSEGAMSRVDDCEVKRTVDQS